MAGDRDKLVIKTPPPIVRAQTSPVVHVDDEVTGRHEGEELAKRRAERPPDDRMHRMEIKHDKLETVVHEIDKRLANQDGQLLQLVAFGAASDAERARRHNAEIEAAKERADRRRWVLLLVKAIAAAIVLVIGALAAAGYFK